jgi:hypothetical protein
VSICQLFEGVHLGKIAGGVDHDHRLSRIGSWIQPMQSLAVYVGKYGNRVGVKNSRQSCKGYSHVTDSAAATVWPQAISPGETDAFCNFQRALPTADLLALLQLKTLNGLDLSPQAAGPPRLWF